MTNSRTAINVAFWVPILGAVAFSYPHLVAWFRDWAPPGWEWSAYGAALMIDALMLAVFYAQGCLGHGTRVSALDRALWASVGLSFYVNLRYGLDVSPGPALPPAILRAVDLAIGAGAAPLLAWLEHEALDAVARAMDGRGTATRPRAPRSAPVSAVPVLVPASAPLVLPPASQAQGAPAPSGGRLAPHEAVALYRALRERHGSDTEAIARDAGRDRKTVERWARMARGMA